MKARLEFEMPVNCSKCYFLIGQYCHGISMVTGEVKRNKDELLVKPDWCPLQPVLTVGDYAKGEG